MPSAAQIVSLVTFFEISQRKSLGCRASPAVLCFPLSWISKSKPEKHLRPFPLRKFTIS